MTRSVMKKSEKETKERRKYNVELSKIIVQRSIKAGSVQSCSVGKICSIGKLFSIMLMIMMVEAFHSNSI